MDAHRLWLTSLAATAALLVAAAPASARTCNSLRGPDDDVVAKSREAVVWNSKGDVFGCHRAARRARQLSVFHGLFNYQLAGRYVAYHEFVEEFSEPVFVRLHVYDLVRGREKLVERMDAGERIAIKRNGSVAWTESTDPEQGQERVWEVHAISNEDGRGEVVLDRGTQLAPLSLRLSRDRRTLQWTNAGAKRTAPLR